MQFDGLGNYLYSFQKLGAASFFININWNFPDQGKVAHHTIIFTETNVHFMHFLCKGIYCLSLVSFYGLRS